MLNDEGFDPGSVAEPIVLREAAPLAAPRRKANSSDTLAVWGAVILVAGVVGIYALVKAYRSESIPIPVPPRVVEADPAPQPRPKLAPVVKRPAALPTRSAPPVVVHHIEPEKKVVDPIEGFDSGEAFDNPASPGRYGQRTSGLLERTTPAARPNQPDPSFGRTPQ